MDDQAVITMTEPDHGADVSVTLLASRGLERWTPARMMFHSFGDNFALPASLGSEPP